MHRLDVGGEIEHLSDIEQFSVALAGLIGSAANAILTPCLMTLLQRPQVNIDAIDSPPTITTALTLYDEIVSIWMSQMPTQTPAHLRVCLSRLASQAAGEISLSSFLVRQPFSEALMEEETSSLSKGKERRSSQGESQYSGSEYDMSIPDITEPASSIQDTQVPLTPEPTPSLTSASSYGARGPNPADMAYERLRRLTDFTSRPSQLQPRMRRILDHWNVGEVPEMYSWTETRQSLEAKGERQLNKRAERRARRHLEKQRKEAERTAREKMRRPSASQPAPQMLPIRSSPPRPPLTTSIQTAAGSGLGVSQTQVLPTVIASQTTHGRHGGRPPQPPFKKRRQGF